MCSEKTKKLQSLVQFKEGRGSVREPYITGTVNTNRRPDAEMCKLCSFLKSGGAGVEDGAGVSIGFSSTGKSNAVTDIDGFSVYRRSVVGDLFGSSRIIAYFGKGVIGRKTCRGS